MYTIYFKHQINNFTAQRLHVWESAVIHLTVDAVVYEVFDHSLKLLLFTFLEFYGHRTNIDGKTRASTPGFKCRIIHVVRLGRYTTFMGQY
jgi:hypothetical protein